MNFGKKNQTRENTILRFSVGGFAAVVAFIFGVLSLFVVPAPNIRSATEISRNLISISKPHPEYGDIGIVLDNGQSYYINRANEITQLDWEKMLAEVHPGDEIHLTFVTPLIWRMLPDDMKTNSPVAGVRTNDTIYMDPVIPATTWTAQGKFVGIAIFSFVVFVLCLLLDLLRLLRQHTTLKVAGS
jgi:hypothetical protein